MLLVAFQVPLNCRLLDLVHVEEVGGAVLFVAALQMLALDLAELGPGHLAKLEERALLEDAGRGEGVLLVTDLAQEVDEVVQALLGRR